MGGVFDFDGSTIRWHGEMVGFGRGFGRWVYGVVGRGVDEDGDESGGGGAPKNAHRAGRGAAERLWATGEIRRTKGAVVN